MKKQLPNLVFTPLSSKELSALSAEVKETLVKDFELGRHKVFSTADLWNIQRNKRRSAGRRFLV
jgi:hypothetical protein